jgi:hypothetical protein
VVFSAKRRFISGAVCPQCKKQDVIMVFHENDADWQTCVDCGHKETLIHQEDKADSAGGNIPLQDIGSPQK